jgi:poly [ADP-ribose] polymerase
MRTMNNYMNNLVRDTYSVKADAVSQAQVDEAQNLINKLQALDPDKNQKKINTLLLELYTTIPRHMKDTRKEVLPHIDFKEAMLQEQDNLDAMAAKVHLIKKEKAKKTPKKSTTKKEVVSLLDRLGVKMVEGKPTKEIKYLLKQIDKADGYRSRGVKLKGILSVDKETEEEVFEEWMSGQKNKQTKYLIHGTRCTSVIPIIEQGLKIRPSGNFQFSGKAYGDGNYFSEVVEKSLGYVGYDSDKVLLVYEVHTGKPFVYDGWYRGNSFSLNYKELQKRGYDSTYVKAGNGILNSEIIAYNEEQCRLKHTPWLN